ncbi:MAG: alcohol dehydrogenase catalytic domain-containing protein [Patescibacteria group bacterium]
MKALVKCRAEKGLELQDIPIPEVKPGTVLVKIAAAGICGSDHHIYKWDDGRNALSNNVPYILGHEGSGTVEKVGEGVTNIAEGDRVAFESHIHDDCSYVKRGLENICPHKSILGIGSNGVFAEYALVPQHIVRIAPLSIPLTVASVFEPATIGIRALEHLSELLSKQPLGRKSKVAVFGATGIMGGVAALAARWFGFDVLAFGRSKEKLAVISSLDSSITTYDITDVDISKKLSELSVDAVIETTGAPQSLEIGRSLIVSAGVWIQIGIFGSDSDAYRILLNDVVRREIMLKGVVGRTRREWNRLFDLVGSGALQLTPLITDRYALEDFEAAFRAKEGIKSVFVLE